MHEPRVARASIGILVFVLSSGVVMAQEPAPARANEAETEYQNEASLFVGSTFVHEETAFTFGVDYERRINRWVGVGGILDFERGNLKETLFGPGLLVTPIESLAITLAPLVSHRGDENNFTFRFGVAYKFEVGRFFIGPQYNLDVSEDETAHDVGVSAGVSF